LGIKVYNTMSRVKEELLPREPGKISMYVCGPTVYNYVHIGNARTFLNFDMVRRYLEYSGFDVTFVQNVTDVDDKIINRANEEGVTPDEVATSYRLAFEEDMAALGVRPPDIAPMATKHIAEMIEVIDGLLKKGCAYESGGDVYFEVAKFPGYGKLSGRTLEEQQVTVQFQDELDRKRDVYDFALWKTAKPGEPYWESPWGRGRPGWHIECSTMSMKYLGESFDVHGGGQDLVFPHHENEIAQAESYSGRTFARYWMHSGMLNIDQEKMSKSLGNIKLLREVLKEHSPDTVRMLMLGTHYRSPLSFSDESLEEARASLDRINKCVSNIGHLISSLGEEDSDAAGISGEDLEAALGETERDFREAMDDDFNSAAALGAVFGLVREVNSYIDGGRAGRNTAARGILLKADSLIRELCGALGLKPGSVYIFARAATASSEGLMPEVSTAAIEPLAGDLIELLLQTRQAARESKNFALADMIRGRLVELGVRVEDVRDGYRWRYER
jgi:cysteinyl-tRNA synthetase